MDIFGRADEYENIVKAIIIARSRDGATISEIREDFNELCGDDFPQLTSDFRSAKKYLLAIEGVYYKRQNSCYFWYVKSENSEHINKMVKEQKPPRHPAMKRLDPFGNNHYSNDMPRKRFQSSENSCFFQDNYNYRLKHYLKQPGNGSRSTSSRYSGSSSNTSVKTGPACFYDYQLIGDDFFLELALGDLHATQTSGSNIRKSGLCVSGQTIKDVAKRISYSTITTKKVIINVGSVDLLHGADIMDMKFDFNRLHTLCREQGLETIITTLAPIANIGHMPEIRHKWNLFNKYLLTNFEDVVDITPCFQSKLGHTLFDCYQPMARYVSGSNQPHILWNRVGRQRVLKYLKVKVSDIDRSCYRS